MRCRRSRTRKALAEAQGDETWRTAFAERVDEERRRLSLGWWCLDKARSWTWFTSQTFRKSYSLMAGLRLFSRFLAELPLSLTPEEGLLVSEPHPSGHGAHVHALLRMTDQEPDPPTSTRRPIQERWRRLNEESFRNLGIARWKPFDHRAGAIGYVTRYLWKRRQPEMEWAIYPDR